MWSRNVVKLGKYSLAKFAILFMFVSRAEIVTIFSSKMVRFSTRTVIHRGYYTAARRYDFYLRVVKTIFYERAQRVKYCF